MIPIFGEKMRFNSMIIESSTRHTMGYLINWPFFSFKLFGINSALYCHHPLASKTHTRQTLSTSFRMSLHLWPKFEIKKDLFSPLLMRHWFGCLLTFSQVGAQNGVWTMCEIPMIVMIITSVVAQQQISLSQSKTQPKAHTTKSKATIPKRNGNDVTPLKTKTEYI